MWIELIEEYCNSCKFAAPANSTDIEVVEEALGTLLHSDLKTALLESNGVLDEYGLEPLWETKKIKSKNIEFRKKVEYQDLYMPFDNLLFFADAGNGDHFAYPIQNEKINRSDIFIWNHEDDSRTWVSPSLRKYFEWWLNGQLGV
ncbi:MAG: SMI1/KNR4 family protein [Bacteroidota bacterium]